MEGLAFDGPRQKERIEVPGPAVIDLRDGSSEATRQLTRERCGCTRSAARLLVEPVEVISFLMNREMLRGIKQRGQRAAVQPGDSSLTAGGA
jgi:hypothetical protein